MAQRPQDGTRLRGWDSVEPTDRILFQSDGLTIASFSVLPASRRFEAPDPIANQIVVFPRVPVRLAPLGGPERVADPTVATLYRQGQRYRRHSIQGAPDRCDWFSLSSAWFREVAGEGGGRFFDDFVLPCPSPLFAVQRRVVRYLESTPRSRIDAAAVEAAALELMRRLFRDRESRTGKDQGPTWLVEKVKRSIAERRGTRITVAGLADQVGCSVAHLSRVFKGVTGETVHRYRLRLRLGLALEEVETRDLSRVALDYGFCSHSHFTDTFRRVVGSTPSGFRGSVSRLP